MFVLNFVFFYKFCLKKILVCNFVEFKVFYEYIVVEVLVFAWFLCYFSCFVYSFERCINVVDEGLRRVRGFV